MKIAVAWFLLVAVAMADVDYDKVTELVEAEQFEKAYEVLQAGPVVDEKDERFQDLWRRSVRGVARDRQRVGGYMPAIEFLEAHLNAKAIVDDYTETCIWAGEEARGLRKLRALPQPLRDQCVVAELQFHWVRQDYAAIEKRAQEVDRQDWVGWAREQGALRERFTERTSRAWWVTIVGVVAIALACWIIDRWLRARA